MDQVLHHRGVRYVVGHQVGAVREWTIYPDGEACVQKGQTITAQGIGSFKAAVRAAQAAIDVWLDSNGVAKSDGADLIAGPAAPPATPPSPAA